MSNTEYGREIPIVNTTLNLADGEFYLFPPYSGGDRKITRPAPMQDEFMRRGVHSERTASVLIALNIVGVIGAFVYFWLMRP
jgi:hypothetical protein